MGKRGYRMNRIAIGVSVVATAATAFATSAHAQGAPARDVSISASVRAEHQSNAAHASAAQAAASGLARSDQMIAPNVAVNIALPFGAHSFSLTGAASYTFHRRNTRRDREDLNFASSLAMKLPVCDPTFSASLSRRLSDLGDIVTSPGANPITVQNVENVETVKSLGGTVACGKDFGLRPTFGADYQEGRNDEPLRKFRDRNVTNYTAGLGYVHPSIGDLLIFAQQRETRYPNQILPDGRENGNRQRSGGVRFSRDIGSRLKGSVEVTYAELKARQAGVRPFTGLNWQADLSAQATSRMALQASVSRATSSSLAVDANYNVNTSYSLNASYVVTPLITLQAGASTIRRRFEGTQIVGPLQQLASDRRYTFTGGINYQFSPKLLFSIDASHERRNGNGSFFDYTNNRIGLNVSLAL